MFCKVNLYFSMQIVFFCNKEGSPLEDFFCSRYGKNFNLDYPNLKKELPRIGSAWRYALEKEGIADGTNLHLEKMRGFDYLCIRIKQSKTLIRFPYYRDKTNERLVLLSGFVKVDGYTPNGKVDRFTKRELAQAQRNYVEYNKNNNSFKKSKIIDNILSF